MSRNNINTNNSGSESFLDLDDTPKSYAGEELKYCQVNNNGTGLQFAPASGSGITTFVELTDCPSSYAGQANKQVVVNNSETGLEFITNGAGVTKFIECTDTPMTYAGTGSFDIVNVTTGHNALQFTSLPNLAGFTLPLESLQNTPATNPPAGQVLTSTGSGSWVGSAINFNSLVNNLDVLDTFTNDELVINLSQVAYYINLNYVTQNDGFTLNLPNLFTPSIAETFNISWSFFFRLAKTTTSTTNGVTITIDLLDSSNNLVLNLFSNVYGFNILPTYPTYLGFNISGNSLVPLITTKQYKYRIACINNSTVQAVHYNKQNKHFFTSGKVDTHIIDNIDYLSTGYPPGVMTCNGTNGFEVVNGNNNDVLQIVGGAPAWVPLASSEIPDPLYINNVLERTLDNGVNINNNIKVLEGATLDQQGIQFKNNTLNIIGNVPAQMNTYIYGTYTAIYTDSQTTDIIGECNIYFNKIGGMCYCTVGPCTTSNLLNASSYVVLGNVIQNGVFTPKNDVDSTFGTVVWKSSTDANYRNDAVIFYDASSGLFRFPSMNRTDGGYNASGKNFTTGQYTFCWLGQDN